MNLYLMRHARPVPGERMDADRPLTDAGRQQAADMAEWLKNQIGRVDAVICSAFMRGIETAEIMAEALGSHVTRTPMLDPDVKPEDAWRSIESIAGYYSDVLVVSHHPLVGHLIDALGSVGGISHIFEHGSIAYVETYAKELHWLVNPSLVERDDDLTDAAEEVAEAAGVLMQAGLQEVDAPVRGGLKHVRHAQQLGPIRKAAAKAVRKFFKRQEGLLLSKIRPRLRGLREARADTDAVIPDQLPISITGGMSFDYSKALTAAVTAGYDSMASDAGSDSDIAVDTVQKYLTDHSLTKLSGDIDPTTIEQLRKAIATAYDAGADYEGLVDAVKETYDKFSDVRAGMIAQTEMNAAYNAGRKQLGIDLGFNEKSWDPDGEACEAICVPNVLDGWIAIEDDFESGDDAPPGHPNCDCSLNVRNNPATGVK